MKDKLFALLAIVVGILAFMLQSQKLKAAKKDLDQSRQARKKEQSVNKAMVKGLNKEAEIRENSSADRIDLD